MEGGNISACPRDFNCSYYKKDEDATVSFSIGTVPSYASLVSSSLSCLGSVLIVLAFLSLPEIRTGAQKLITLLSIADFFTAAGYFVAGINFLRHYNPEDGQENSDCGSFETVCEIQSFITTTSSLSSFLWTMILAGYFHAVIVNRQTLFTKKSFALFNFIAWGVPIIITIPLLITGYLGYSPLATSNWCYIKDSQYYKPKSKVLVIALFMVAGKFWEILSYIIVTALYISIAVSIYRSHRRLAHVNHNGSPRINHEHVELRLLSIPLVFLLLRIWGTAQFSYSLVQMHSDVKTCISPQVHRVFLTLGVLQAIGDSGQGWSNALLYIFLSPTIRNAFICEPLTKCCYKLQTLYQSCNESLLPNEVDYSRIRQSSHEPIGVEKGDVIIGREALNRRHERTALNRTSDTSLYGAVIIAQSSDGADDQGKEEPNKELLDTASLSVHTTVQKHQHRSLTKRS